MYEFLKQQKKLMVWALVAPTFLVPVLLMVWGHYTQQVPWRRTFGLVGHEGDAITWLSSAQLLLTGLAAYGNYALIKLSDLRTDRRTPYRWVWIFFLVGFVYLACDEAFMFHERIRRHILRPNRLFTDLPLVESGNVVLLFYLLVGMAMLYFFFRVLKSNRHSVRLFIAAVAVIAPVVVIDAIDPAFLERTVVMKEVRNMLEEIFENLAEVLFLLSFLVILFERFEQFLKHSARVEGNYRPVANSGEERIR